jgi:hypothetical protein
MNERIKEKISEISQKARQHANEYVDDEVESQYELKFAELILADYAKQLVQANMSNHWYVQSMDEYYEQKWAHRFG